MGQREVAMPWYDEVFSGLYDAFTFHLFTEERNRRDAEFIMRALRLRTGETVLDTACGHGRHANLLAAEGMQVTGIDREERYLAMARAKLTQWRKVEFIRIDLRELDIEVKFDAAYNFFTSFGFFDDETNFDILRRIARSLKPGGRFLIDLQNRELYTTGQNHYSEYSEYEWGGRPCALLLESDFDPETSRATIRQRLYGPVDGPLFMEFDVRLYTMAELRWLLGQAGFSVVSTYGDINGSDYSMTTPRCIAVAIRK